MKALLFLPFLIGTTGLFGQINIPETLVGTWKIENKNQFEKWDQFNENSLKGISYHLVDQEIVISEYLSIATEKNKTTYQATVLNQNNGNPIHFKRIKDSEKLIFENLKHDFPKQISYEAIDKNTIKVTLSDLNNQLISYNLIRTNSIQKPELSQGNKNPNYDEKLAKELQADNYGMKSYFFVILKTGSNPTKDQNLIAESFKGHMANINRLVEEKKLVIAGPFGKNDHTFRGLFILQNIKNIAEAESILKTDPAIQNNLLTFDIYNWYGSAALPVYLEASDKIWKTQP